MAKGRGHFIYPLSPQGPAKEPSSSPCLTRWKSRHAKTRIRGAKKRTLEGPPPRKSDSQPSKKKPFPEDGPNPPPWGGSCTAADSSSSFPLPPLFSPPSVAFCGTPSLPLFFESSTALKGERRRRGSGRGGARGGPRATDRPTPSTVKGESPLLFFYGRALTLFLSFHFHERAPVLEERRAVHGRERERERKGEGGMHKALSLSSSSSSFFFSST